MNKCHVHIREVEQPESASKVTNLKHINQELLSPYKMQTKTLEDPRCSTQSTW